MSKSQKTVIFHKKNFKKIFGPQNPFLKIYLFGQGHSTHACKIWAGSVEKWMSSSQKTVIFSEKKFSRKFLDPKTHFWKLTFLGKVILHMPVKFEQAQMRNEWVVRKKRSFFHKKHFTFLGKVILHMPVKFEQARLKNEGGVRKKRSFFQKNNF